MRFSKLTSRMAGQGAAAWDVHARACAAQAKGEDVVVMSLGETDFATPDAVIEEAIRALRGGDTKYTPILGQAGLRRAVADWARTSHGIPVNSEGVAITSGCQHALYAAAQLLLEEGDEVLVLEPMFVTYEASLKATGAILKPIPCPASNRFHPDMAALRAALSPRSRAIFLATPVNPSGAVLTREELHEIAGIAQKNDLWVVSDEVYAELVYEGSHLAIASLAGMAERTVTLGSLSKSHAMTGWRAGWALAPEDFIAHMFNLTMCMTFGMPGFVQQGAAFALEHEMGFPAKLRDALRRRRDRLFAILSPVPNLTCWLPEAGMFLLLGVGNTGLTSQEFSRRLYDEEGVSTLDGGAFGASAEGTLRLSFAVSDDQLEKGGARIRRFAESLLSGEGVSCPHLASN